MKLHTLIPNYFIKKAEEDAKSSDILKYVGLALAPDVASYGYSKSILNRLAGNVDKVDEDIFSRLHTNIQNENKVKVKQHFGGSAYNAINDEIKLNHKHYNPGVLAHEYGHVQGGKPLAYTNGVGKLVGGLGTLTAILSGNEDTGRNAAIAGSIGMAGTLASELDASRRGYNVLRSLGGSKGKSLKAFMGIPTYLASSLAPFIAYKAKQKTIGYDK